MELKLDWLSHRDAAIACSRWHYSGTMPVSPNTRVGVWENESFTGVVVFARGSSNHIGKPYALAQTEVVELARIALREHLAPVSRIIRVALAMLKRNSPGLRLVVSYADPAQDHLGIVYQAANWIYVGETPPGIAYVDRHGRRWHSRMVSESGFKRAYNEMRSVVKPSECTSERIPGKFKYLWPYDREMREQITPLALSYPRAGSIVGDASAVHAEEGGSTPTPALTP